MKVESKKDFPLSQNIKEIPLFSFVRKDKPTNRQTNRQTDKQTNTQTDKQTHKQRNRQTDKQTDKHSQSCSENMPFGKPLIKGCLAEITGWKHFARKL